MIMALTPTYASIGIAAPVLIVVARLIQGFSAGGEMGSALSYLIEYAPKHRRSLYASFQQLTQILALLIGSLMGAAVNSWLSTAEVESWGWRVPFFLGLVIAPVGWYRAYPVVSQDLYR
jgi:MHS family proline/betaine transporter-like MFS transporter